MKMKVKYCLDIMNFNQKPTKKDTIGISNRISQYEEITSVSKAALKIGSDGHTFAPATFGGRERKNQNFVSQQLFALDFDDTIAFKEVEQRCGLYKVHMAFAYETFSSVNENKFRVVFKHIVPINEPKIAYYIQQALMFIFPECDKSCSDLARLYFGGKGILYINEDSTIEINYLTRSLAEYVYDKYNKDNHVQRKMDEFSKKTGVVQLRGLPMILTNEEKSGVNEDDLIKNSIRYSVNTRDSPGTYYLYFFENNGNGKTTTNLNVKRRNPVKSFNWDNLVSYCELFRKFKLGEHWLYYNELFGLALNLCTISGGSKRFIDILNSDVNQHYFSYRNRDYNGTINYINKMEYKPMHCERFCPFHNECEHCDTPIQTAKTGLNKIEKIYTDMLVGVEIAQDNLETAFIKAQQSDKNKIHLIKAQTGMGKSHTYLKYLEQSDKPYIIAVPTNALKLELLEKALNNGYKAISTPSLPDNIPENIADKIENMYACGAGRSVMKYVRSVFKNNEAAVFNEYIKETETYKSFNGHIITTHARFLTLSKEFLSNYNIIIDEDIMRSLMPIHTVGLKSIQQLIDSNQIDMSKKDYLINLINLEYGAYVRQYKSGLSINEDEAADIINRKISDNIIDLFSADVVHKSKKDSIIYLIKKSLPDRKIIILSATAEEEIYKLYFGKNKIKVYDVPEAKNMGKLIQYPAHSFSRNFFSNNMDVIKEIEQMPGVNNVITFKDYKKYYTKATDMNFGNTEGKNGLAGEDITVVGTPHLHPVVYNMYAAALGLDISEEEMRIQEVRRGNYKFWFCTFQNELLRMIQFWLIESELVQSVGRARLLRNDCTVKLFSNFPMSQAEFDYKKFNLGTEKSSEEQSPFEALSL